MEKKKISNPRSQSIFQLVMIIGILAFINVIGSRFYSHLDLTEDKRFSLTPPTQNLIKNLDDRVDITVFLEGQFSSDVKRLRNGVQDILNEFKSLSNNVNYQFINPLDGDPEDVNKQLAYLKENGIPEYSDLRTGNEEFSAKRVFPGALVSYHGRNFFVYFLEASSPGMPKEIRFNNSIGMLEYKFANAIQKLQMLQRPKVAFSTGHGELNIYEREGFKAELRRFYDVADLHLDSIVDISNQVDVLVVAKPRYAFSTKDKFKIDQYVMNGGKILWLIDRLNADIDSLRRAPEGLALDLPLELDDLLFRYGIRINNTLIKDLQCTKIPLQVGMTGDKPQFGLKPWYYFPVVFPDPSSAHPIVKNLDGIELKFASSIDTTSKTKTPIRRTVLLRSSEFSIPQKTPMPYSFDIVRNEPNKARYNKGFQNLAVLMEGVFPSLYENRVTDEMAEGYRSLGKEIKYRSPNSKMIVVADGDIARCDYNLEQKRIIPLGYNQYEKYTFANKDFLLNCIEYLLDSDGLIQARSKEFKLRLLDKTKMATKNSFFGIPMETKTKWQIINLILPILLLVIFGILFNFVRKKRYAA